MRDDRVLEAFGLLERERAVEPTDQFADALFRRLRSEVAGGRPLPSPAGPGPRRRTRFRWALAPAALVVVVASVIVAGLLVASPPRSALAVVEEAQRKLGGVPPFDATIVYDLNSEGAGAGIPSVEVGIPRGATATLGISYGGAGRYRQQILREHRVLPGSGLPGVGSFIVWDGREIGLYAARENAFGAFAPSA